MVSGSVIAFAQGGGPMPPTWLFLMELRVLEAPKATREVPA
jgi:hypothetical protein